MSIWLLFLLVLALAILPLAWVGARTLFRYRATRVVQCPETGLPAAVHVDGARAALGSAIGGADLRLQSCSRWPERNVCGQRCLSQIETAPADCFARTLLVDWYRGSSCALCGKAIGRLHWVEHKPALLTPERKTIEWDAITPENLAEVLATYQRVCWVCHTANAWLERLPGFRADVPAKGSS